MENAAAAASERTQPSRAKVFISYSRKDRLFADRVEMALKARGFEPLIDRTEIYAFEEWWKRIEALIVRADTVVFLLSPDSVSSEVALKEVAFAASLNKRFAPIVCRRVDDSAVPEVLAKFNFVFFDDDAGFEADADRLAEALNTDIGWIRQHTEFGDLARRWALANEPGGLLLRSLVLEQAERWIATRPGDAPAPTEETQTFVRRSRQAATRRRNILSGGLASGLVLALGLAGVAYWQRGLAVEQRGIAVEQRGIAVEQRSIAERNEAQAKEERDRATRNFALAQKTAESLVFDIAQGLRTVQGMSVQAGRKILQTAKETFEQLAAAAPDDLALQRARGAMLTAFGTTYFQLGDLEQAAASFSESLSINQRLAAADPNNKMWQRDLSISYYMTGEVLLMQGKPDEALTAYRASVAIREMLAAADPNSTQAQEDLWSSYNVFGDAFKAQGKSDDALKIYRDGLAIVERLAAADRNNPAWRRDLSISYDKVADMLMAQGKLDEALQDYRESLTLRERLAADDPSNTLWQRALSISYNNIGAVFVARGKLDDALKLYRDSLAIHERLAAADRSNMQWQRDVLLSYNRVGDMLMAQRKLDDALKAYRSGLAFADRLAAANRNTQAQRDLAISYEKIGSVLFAQGKLDDALGAFRNSLAIREPLAAANRSNPQWQRELMMSYNGVGNVLLEQKKLDEALRAYRDGLAIVQAMAAADPGNKQLQGDIQFSAGRIARVAFRFIPAQNFNTALEASELAISLAPEIVWQFAIRAHVLMFLGRDDEARALYLRYRGEKNVLAGKSWPALVADDFVLFRKLGLVRSLMDEIESQFAAGG